MAAGLPLGGKVEIEFTAGVWTDISADVEPDPFTIRKGRSSEFSAPAAGTLDGLRLNNTTGVYTPLSQVLVDGVTPNPYYPNVMPRKRIRYSNTPSGVRFLGYIKGWPPFVDQDGTSWVIISATDRQDQLSRIILTTPIAQEIAASVPARYWPMGDTVGSSSALELAGGSPLTMSGATNPVAFGSAGPLSGDGTSVTFAPSASRVGQLLDAPIDVDITAFTWEAVINVGAWPAWAPGIVNVMGLASTIGLAFTFQIYSNGSLCVADTSSQTSIPVNILDGGWHHIAVTRSGNSLTIYSDGVGYTVVTPNAATRATHMIVGDYLLAQDYSPLVSSRFPGRVAQIALYSRALSATEILGHAAAVSGYYGDTSDKRIARWLGFGGLTSADWSLDTGKAIVATYPQAGKDIVSACQDIAVTEGGGSAFYVGVDGRARFTSRQYRKPGSPVMTIDAEADLDGGSYAPSFDEMTLVNSTTGIRAAASGTLTTQTVRNAASIAAFGISMDPGGTTSYATTDSDVLALAQYDVAANGRPGFRLPQVGIDFVTATASLYAALGAVQLGSRIRVTNLPPSMAPASQVDLIVEGWAETVSASSYHVVFDTSPADNPFRASYDDAVYGTYQAQGQTLTATITASATSLQISTTAGLPTFTTAAGVYPMEITLGQEIVVLTAAPSSAASPQTFTVSRGTNGTRAAAQAIGSPVALWPLLTYTL